MDFKAIRATKQHSADMGFIHAKSWQKAYAGIIIDDIISKFTQEKRAEVFKEAIDTRPEEYYLFLWDSSPAVLPS